MPLVRATAGTTLILLVIAITASARADALRRIERETDSEDDEQQSEHRNSGRAEHRSRSDSSWQSATNEDESNRDDSDDELGRGVFKALLFPWTLPHFLLDDPCLQGYAAQPFAGGQGLLRDACDLPPDQPPPEAMAFAFATESGYLLQGVVPASFSLRLLFPLRIELAARSDWLHDVESRARDRAFMTTAHVVYRFAQAKHVDLRTGIGPRHFRLDQTRLGVDVLYAIDIYGRRPIVSRIELHGGFLGDAWVGQARATLGGIVGKLELYAGYDHTYISDGQGPGTRLGGPIAGVRAWF